MFSMLKTIAISAAIALAIVSPAMAQDVSQAAEAPAAAAGEIPQAVMDACKDDYEKHCIAHAPEGAAARDCMAHAFEKLSDPCVTAILDSPLVEQQSQQIAKAQASEQSGTDDPKAAATKPATRTAKARHAAVSKSSARKYYAGQHSAGKSKRHVAQHRQKGPRRNVAGHIRRGTGIASHYVAKYTRFAFARAFR